MGANLQVVSCLHSGSLTSVVPSLQRPVKDFLPGTASHTAMISLQHVAFSLKAAPTPGQPSLVVRILEPQVNDVLLRIAIR